MFMADLHEKEEDIREKSHNVKSSYQSILQVTCILRLTLTIYSKFYSPHDILILILLPLRMRRRRLHVQMMETNQTKHLLILLCLDDKP